jgi:hypothetical protein
MAPVSVTEIDSVRTRRGKDAANRGNQPAAARERRAIDYGPFCLSGYGADQSLCRDAAALERQDIVAQARQGIPFFPCFSRINRIS